MQSSSKQHKKVACVDLDGVLNMYSGWVSDDHFPEPRPGVERFLFILSQYYTVVILTCRTNISGVWDWLEENDLKRYINDITNTKIAAHIYIDDRGINFSGDFDEILSIAIGFQPHWKEIN